MCAVVQRLVVLYSGKGMEEPLNKADPCYWVHIACPY